MKEEKFGAHCYWGDDLQASDGWTSAEYDDYYGNIYVDSLLVSVDEFLLIKKYLDTDFSKCIVYPDNNCEFLNIVIEKELDEIIKVKHEEWKKKYNK